MDSSGAMQNKWNGVQKWLLLNMLRTIRTGFK